MNNSIIIEKYAKEIHQNNNHYWSQAKGGGEEVTDFFFVYSLLQIL